MAASLIRKQCASNDGCKQPAAVNCEGCSQAFCIKHLLDHRRLLSEEMNIITDEHDHLQHILNQQTTNSDSHPLIKEIDEWEKEATIKIQQKAKELREQLHQLITIRFDDLSKKLRHLSEKLNEGREHDAYIETDLRDWKKTLDDLKTNISSFSTFGISRHAGIPFVQNISINLIGTNELFDRTFDNKVRIEENGRVAIHDSSHNYTEIRGKNEYTAGRHEIRLRIEQSSNNWTFLGINAQSTPLQNYSHSSKSAYGWTNNNYVWSNGQSHANTIIPRIEIKTNDIISLIFDCDNRKISMINERTNTKYELAVDLNSCSFSWQLHVILFEANSRVRILSA